MTGVYRDDTYAATLARFLRFREIGVDTLEFDPLGNQLSLSTTYDECPNTGCKMILPHLHSVIPRRLCPQDGPHT